MDLAELISYFMTLPEVEECTPFGPEALVYKVAGKIFAIVSPDDFPSRVNLKCEPEYAVELRERYAAVLPGWHMNKRHWNTVLLDDSLSGELLRELALDSYRLVVQGLKAAERKRLLAACAKWT